MASESSSSSALGFCITKTRHMEQIPKVNATNAVINTELVSSSTVYEAKSDSGVLDSVNAPLAAHVLVPAESNRNFAQNKRAPVLQ